MKRGKYIGSNLLMKGKTALIMGCETPGWILIQADDVSTGYGYGWHAFPTTDWEIKEFTL